MFLTLLTLIGFFCTANCPYIDFDWDDNFILRTFKDGSPCILVTKKTPKVALTLYSLPTR